MVEICPPGWLSCAYLLFSLNSMHVNVMAMEGVSTSVGIVLMKCTQNIQCGVLIMWSIFSQNLSTERRDMGVFLSTNAALHSVSLCYTVCNIICWTAL